MLINLTPDNLFEQIIMYGVVHGVWEFISWLRHRAKKEIKHIQRTHRRHRNAIIKNHVKADHGGRLKHCVDEACSSLRTPVLHPVVPQTQPEQVARTE